ncbi:hypothetical protein ITJ86_14030 [Winogradskyella sp. F6397]|uniref:Carboxypeptidase-like regulatory domain-containing protein n=1 Tax=Winogradskyella marina TaxID=2785530 RepID=A0ABS0EKN0_9FLAO|nr:hypothetical protein [Winogradskyella marina]MBF8151025.1 hypothetical protein [Winogradskyella marina]
MRKITVLTLLLSFPCIYFAQTLNGKVYDAKGSVKNIKVFNETQKSITLTNTDGDFSINAKVNDTISFQSLFYHPKAVALKDFHFEGTAVFELEEILTELNEVEVKAEPEQPVFNEETYNIELKNIIQEDIKNNPQKYAPIGNNQGIDFVYLARKLFDLLKSKKPKKIEEREITYENFAKLIETSSFFNSQLLTNDLKIPEKHKYLFLEFCAAKQLNLSLLKEENKMQLLEELVLNSQLFLILLEQYGEEPVTKD